MFHQADRALQYNPARAGLGLCTSIPRMGRAVITSGHNGASPSPPGAATAKHRAWEVKTESRAWVWEMWAPAVPTALHLGCDCSVPLMLDSGHWRFSNSQWLASTMLAATRAEPCGRVNKFCAQSCSHLQLRKPKVAPRTAGSTTSTSRHGNTWLHLTAL